MSIRINNGDFWCKLSTRKVAKRDKANKATRIEASLRVEKTKQPRRRPKKEAVKGSLVEVLRTMRNKIATLKNRCLDLHTTLKKMRLLFDQQILNQKMSAKF